MDLVQRAVAERLRQIDAADLRADDRRQLVDADGVVRRAGLGGMFVPRTIVAAHRIHHGFPSRKAAIFGSAVSAARCSAVGSWGLSRSWLTMQRKPSDSPREARNWCQVQAGMVIRSNGLTSRTASPSRQWPWPRRIITACMCS